MAYEYSAEAVRLTASDNLNEAFNTGFARPNEPVRNLAVRLWRRPGANCGVLERMYMADPEAKSRAGWNIWLFCPLYRDMDSILSKE